MAQPPTSVPTVLPPAPVFRSVLRPNRSLSRRGLLIVMGLLGGISLVAGVVFVVLGAWPVFGFLGLDVALVYLAFRINFADARAFELVEVTRDRLTLTRVDKRGRRLMETFEAAWVRVVLNETADGRNHLRLTMRDRESAFGIFLSNDERVALKSALDRALAVARSA